MQDNNLTSDERTWAMLAHLLGLLTGFLAPLIIYLVHKDRSRFVAFHSLQALYFQIAILLLWLILFCIAVITLGFGAILFPIPIVLSLVFEIIATIRANQGEWYEIPVVGAMARSSVSP